MVAIKSVLVATDFSESSARALDYGREFARTTGARLHVMHVVDDPRAQYSLEMTPSWLLGVQENVEASARERLANQLTDDDRRQLRARGIVHMAVSAADAIVAYASSEGIDVIVIGTHGRRGLAHMILGSIAERIVRTAPCPVLTVRRPAHECLTADASKAGASV